jgi:hypothetical protein
MQHGLRDNRPVIAYRKWMDRIPSVYERAVLDEEPSAAGNPKETPNELALLKHYRSLMPMAMEVRKPVFSLKPADGAIGAHGEAVRNARSDFVRLARTIGARTGIRVTQE